MSESEQLPICYPCWMKNRHLAPHTSNTDQPETCAYCGELQKEGVMYVHDLLENATSFLAGAKLDACPACGYVGWCGFLEEFRPPQCRRLTHPEVLRQDT